jgi:hypothetical protein
MRLGNIKVEQIDDLGNIVLDFGEILTNKEIVRIFNKHFKVTQIKPGIISCSYLSFNFYIFFKNISYLGTPHPVYKKRIQIPKWFIKEHDVYSKLAPVFFMGVYKHKDNIVLVNFDNENYLKNKANNSSAHILTDDLVKATLDGFSYRKDIRGNILFAFSNNSITEFICMFVSKTVSATPIMYLEFDKFFQSLPNEWNGIECYMDMINANYSRKYQPEWQSSYQEYMFELQLKSGLIDNSIVTKNSSRGINGIDLDLYFPLSDEFGDLKMHSLNSNAILGNKTETILKCIENNRSVYYVIFEHNTILDKDCDYIVTEFWNFTRDKSDIRSYSGRMKNTISLQNMLILEINQNNIRYINTDFQDGFTNSDGTLRTPKIAIPKKLINNFVVFSSIKKPMISHGISY